MIFWRICGGVGVLTAIDKCILWNEIPTLSMSKCFMTKSHHSSYSSMLPSGRPLRPGYLTWASELYHLRNVNNVKTWFKQRVKRLGKIKEVFSFFFITLGLELSDTGSTSLKYESSSEPEKLHHSTFSSVNRSPQHETLNWRNYITHSSYTRMRLLLTGAATKVNFGTSIWVPKPSYPGIRFPGWWIDGVSIE